MMLPQGVRRTGSHVLSPVTIVVAFAFAGFERSIRCTAGFDDSSSQTYRNCGLSSLGQKAIWSAEKCVAVETTETCSDCAKVTASALFAPVKGPSALC